MTTGSVIALIKALGGGSGGGGSGGASITIVNAEVVDESLRLGKTFQEISEAARNGIVIIYMLMQESETDYSIMVGYISSIIAYPDGDQWTMEMLSSSNATSVVYTFRAQSASDYPVLEGE